MTQTPHEKLTTTQLREKGVSLLETLLAIGASAIISAYIVSTMQSWAEIEKTSATAAYMKGMSDAVNEMTKDYEQFDTLFKQVELAGGAVQIGVLDSDGFPISLQSGAWVSGQQILTGSAQVTPSFANLSPLKKGISVLVSTVRFGPKASDRALKIILATSLPVPEQEARESAAKLGADGGILSIKSVDPGAECLPDGCDKTLRGIYNDWKISLNDFSGTAWAATAQTTPPSNINGAYLLLYRYLSAQESAGDYLYRVPIDGSPELNQMTSNLDMSGNSIVGADNIKLDQLDVVDTVSIQGSVSVTGIFDAHQMAVTGDAIAGTIEVAKTYDDTDPRLNENYDGRITNTITIDGLIKAPKISIDTLISKQITAQKLDASQISSDYFEQGNTLTTQNLAAGTLSSATVTANDFILTAPFTVDSAGLNVQSATANTVDISTLSTQSLVAYVSSQNTGIGLLTSCTGCY